MKTRARWIGMVVCVVVAVGATVFANTVTTPCGASVSHSHPSPDWTEQQKQDLREELEESYPDATVVGEATKSYNCHAYCWAGASEWIGDPGVYSDSYQLDPLNGDELTYGAGLEGGPTHSAVDTGPYEATSKWGSSCLVKHDWDYGPYGDIHSIYGRKDCGC